MCSISRDGNVLEGESKTLKKKCVCIYKCHLRDPFALYRLHLLKRAQGTHFLFVVAKTW